MNILVITFRNIVMNFHFFLGKALNGSNYVQFRLRFREKSSGVRSVVSTVASIFLRRTGIRMEGDEIYTRTIPSDGKRNGTFILKQRTNKYKNLLMKRKFFKSMLFV